MMWQETPYTIPLMAVATVTTVAALHIRRKHQVAAARTVSLVLFAGAGWALTYALEMGVVDLYAKILFSKLQYMAVIIITVGWLIFTLQYTGHEKWVTRRNMILISLIPLITLLLVFTNEYHGLVWSNVTTREGPFVTSVYSHGPWFWVHTVYSYFLILSGCLLLISLLIRSQTFYRWQIILLLIAAFFPMFENALYLLGLGPLSYLGVVIVTFPAVSLAAAWTLFHFRPGDILPVARGTVIEGMSDGVMVLDNQTRIVDANPVIEQLTGCPASQLIGQPIKDVWPEWVTQIKFPNMDTEGEIEVQLHQKREQRTYDVRISPLTDWRDRTISHVVVLRDITESKRAAELLHESEEKFRTIFEHANDEIVLLDSSGTIIDVNRKVEDIFEYKREDLLGKKFFELNLPGLENLAGMADLFTDAVSKNEPIPFFLVELKDRNGNDIYAEVSTKLIERNGNVHGVLSIVRDITQRKEVEKKIKNALREKEVLLREIHHRVKNNLQIISSLLKLQSRYIRDEQYTEMLRDSQNRIRSMALIHEKLYHSENLLNIDFEPYIRSLTDELIRSYGAAKVAVNIEVDTISVSVDTAIPCGLIINELVSNSLKHAFPDGKGEIAVTLHAIDGTIELTVSDTGVGIPDTVDFRTTETLGLRLVTILAEDQLNGDIILKREAGTEFCITFPAQNG